MEAAQPPVVGAANAAQTLRSTVSAEALLASGNAAPSWTQRLRFDLTPMIAAVAPSHQADTRQPAPYYPAPDTSWTKDTAAAEAAPDETPAEPAPKPEIVADAAPAPIVTESAETLLAPPVAPPVAVVPAEPAPAEEPVQVAAAKPAEPEIDIAPAPEPAPAEEAAAPTPEPAPAAEPAPASPSLVAALNWVYGDKTAPVTGETDTDSAEASVSESAPDLSDDSADQPATTESAALESATPDSPSTDLPTATETAALTQSAPPSETALSAAEETFESKIEIPGEKRVIEVRRGDTLFGLLTHAGLTDAEAQAAGHSLADVFSPNDLRVGQEITLSFATGAGPDSDAAGKLVGLTLQPSMDRDVKLTRNADGQFIAASIDRPLTERVDRAAGQIDISLFESARDAGVPVGLIGDIIKAYSYDVDFQRDIHEGDSFEAVFERYDTDKGELAKAGRLLYASLTLGGKPMPIYYFERDGDGEYFTADGIAVRKSLLKTPIDGARITSGYGMRVNPILGYSAMHQGIDFGAPTGTPIFAAGNGVVEFIGRKNGYGNFIKLRHNGTYETAYAHASRFAKGLKKGSRVKQGQVIAYVGTTGRSTGPHLHFEIIVNGKHVNPSKVKTVASDKLTGPQLKAFKAQVAEIQQERNDLINRSEIADQSGGAPVLDCKSQRGCLN